MRYFVIDPQGGRYGPADLGLLNQWAMEGRIAPDTVLQDEITGAKLFASQVQGLNLPAIPYPGSPGVGAPGTHYPPASGAFAPSGTGYAAPGGNALTKSYLLSASALLCCPWGPVALILPIAGYIVAANAEKQGAPNAGGAKLFAIVVIALIILGSIGVGSALF